jgi:hypothetical protein
MWTFKKKELKEIPEGAFGFVYKIIFPNKQYYIGSKQFFSNTNGKISKKRSNELYSGKGRKPTREKKSVESNWKNYKSSSKTVQEMLKTTTKQVVFEILSIHPDKQSMLLHEAKMIIDVFVHDVKNFLNEWVKVTLKKPNQN